MSKLFNKIMSTRLKYPAGAGIILIIVMLFYSFQNVAVEQVETFEAVKGEFVISVVIGGELIANESRVISAPRNIRGNLQIVEIVPEGNNVKKGDFLLKFDTAELENKLLSQEEDLENQLIQREELVASQTANMVQKEAQLQIQKYSYEQAKIQFEMSQFEPEIKKQQMEIDMKKADLQMLEAKEDITRQKLRNKNDLRRRDEKIRRKKDDIREIKDQIEAATINAPIDGLVVYKENRMTKEKIKVGESVHRGMQIVEIPDLSLMKVKTAVNEVDISKIRRGQEVIISLDANENTYYGSITDIARLARSELGAVNVKVFDVEVTIKNNDETLKPGMSATCQIITDRLEDVVSIPIQSVFEEEGETFVYADKDYKKVTIVTGQRNTDFIVINEGFEEGRLVALRDPFLKLEAIGKDIKEKPKVSKSANGQSVTPESIMREFRGRMGGMIRH